MSADPVVPFVNLVDCHREIEEGLVSVFRAVLQTGGFIGGPFLEQFERDFSRFCDTKYCAGVGSGTDALRFALLAAGVRKGDVVLTAPNTFIATTEAISQVGASPQFVDVEEDTFNIDPEKLREFLEYDCVTDASTGRRISRKTGLPVTAIVPVHLYGRMADMDVILEVAEEHKLIVVEDACQAHGAEYFSTREQCWKRAGSMGKAAAFSFYPAKNLGAFGEAGAVTTNDETIARVVCMLRDHGQSQKYYHAMEGYNGRLDALQAGILCAKLPYLSDWNEKRRQAAQRYDMLLQSMSGYMKLPRTTKQTRPVYHLYVVRSPERDQLRDHLAKAGIGTGIHYPIPLHLQTAYQALGYSSGDFPVSENLSGEILSLPMFPTLQPEQQSLVVNEINVFTSMAIA